MTDMSRVVARLLLLPTFLVAFGVMLKGYADVGDGFSAGVIASLGIGLQLIVFGERELQRLSLVHFAPQGIFLGLFIALTTAFVPAIRGEALFLHEPRAGEEVVHFGTFELLSAVAFDVGVFLVVFGFGVGTIASIVRAEARLARVGAHSVRGPARRASEGEAG